MSMTLKQQFLANSLPQPFPRRAGQCWKCTGETGIHGMCRDCWDKRPALSNHGASAKPQPQSTGPAQVGGDHYSRCKIEPWDYIVANDLGYLAGNVVKYVTRYKSKGDPVGDLKKARQYIDKLIEGLEAKP